jgi:hypothetical protein
VERAGSEREAAATDAGGDLVTDGGQDLDPLGQLYVPIAQVLPGTLWAAGSWLNCTALTQRARPATRLGVALALIAVGSAGPVLLVLDLAGLAPGLTLWGLAALGMGLAGTVIALQGAGTDGPTFAVLMALGGAMAVVGALAARRISPAG